MIALTVSFLFSVVSSSKASDVNQLIEVVWRSAETDYVDVPVPFDYLSESELRMTPENVNGQIYPKSLPVRAIPTLDFVFEQGMCLRVIVGESLTDAVFAQSGNQRMRGMLRLEPGIPSSFCFSDGTEISLWNSGMIENLGLDTAAANHLAVDYWAVITLRVKNLPINEGLIQRNVAMRLNSVAHFRRLAQSAANRSLQSLITWASSRGVIDHQEVVRAASDVAVAAAIAGEDAASLEEQYHLRPETDAVFRSNYVKPNALSLSVTQAALRLVDSMTRQLLPGFGNAKLRVALEAGVFLRSLSMRD